ncbi:MAG TPA: metallophosphoesterase [Actinomycetota bacterium]|nr:metallophosphoesterase [Actinomycetota bacterium]
MSDEPLGDLEDERLGDLADDLITDLLRSAWVIEAGRAAIYALWEGAEARFASSATRAAGRAEIVRQALDERGVKPDRDLVNAHGRWITSLVGTSPNDVLFGDIFLVRLADWVDGHATPFLGAQAHELRALSDKDRADIKLPTELPEPAPFEPLHVPQVEAPGTVRFRIGILADLHIGSSGAEERARDAIADLNRAGVDITVQLGDITDHGDRAEFDTAAKLLAECDMPVVTMMGNHDVFSVGELRLSGRDYYPSSFGREPDGVLIEHKGWNLAILDSTEYGATPFPPFDLVTGGFLEGPGGAVVRGALTDPQHEILATVAAPGAPPAFVFLHHPPQPFTSFPPIIFGLNDLDSGRVHATVDSGNVWGVFAGHTHRNARSRDYEGLSGVSAVPAHEVATPRDFPCGYAVIDVADEGYAYRFVQLSDEDLLRAQYRHAGPIFRRYAAGRPEERAFVWSKDGD